MLLMIMTSIEMASGMLGVSEVEVAWEEQEALTTVSHVSGIWTSVKAGSETQGVREWVKLVLLAFCV